MPLNYDPKHVISNRRLENDRSTFQHSAIPDLRKEANSLEFDFPWSFQRVPNVVQTEASTDPGKDESTKKRPISEATDMGTEQQESGKKPKIVTELEIIDVDQPLNQEVHIPTYVQEENPQLESSSEQSAECGKVVEEHVLKIREYSYATATEGQFKSKNELLVHYVEQRKQSLAEE